jgi:hypothetical protein
VTTMMLLSLVFLWILISPSFAAAQTLRGSSIWGK